MINYLQCTSQLQTLVAVVIEPKDEGRRVEKSNTNKRSDFSSNDNKYN